MALLRWLGLALMLAAVVPESARAAAGEKEVVDVAAYSFEECASIERQALRGELRQIAEQALQDDAIDIPGLVNEQWLLLDVSQLIADEVARSVAVIRDREGYLSRLWSAWSADKAKGLAAEIATATFESAPFQQVLEDLSTAIAGNVAVRMETASLRSVSNTLGCLQVFIGRQYSASLLDVFTAEVNTQVGDVELARSLTPDISIAGMHTTGLTGVGVIIGAQIARRLAVRLSQRIAGRIVTRVAGRAAATLVPLVGWVAGAGMIAWDLWEGADGALPHIEEALTSDSVAEEIQSEIVAAVAPELDREIPKVAREVSTSLFNRWIEFKKQYADVLRLADRNPNFKAILRDTNAADIYKLGNLVAVATEQFGSSELDVEIDRGRFERLLGLPEGAATILAGTGSIETTLAWGELAGEYLPGVVQFKIFASREPGDIDQPALAALVAVNDEAAITSLLSLNGAELTDILVLPAAQLRGLKRYTDDDLSWLANYVGEFADAADRDLFVRRVQRDPGLMSVLKHERLKGALVNAQSLDDALSFISAPGSITNFVSDVSRWASGSVPTSLVAYKYATPRNTIVVAVVLVSWLGLKLLRRRRDQRPIVVNVTVPPQEVKVVEGEREN